LAESVDEPCLGHQFCPGKGSWKPTALLPRMQDTVLESKVVIFVSILEVTVERSLGFHGRFFDQRSWRK
jgi:hypothetical protein